MIKKDGWILCETETEQETLFPITENKRKTTYKAGTQHTAPNDFYFILTNGGKLAIAYPVIFDHGKRWVNVYEGNSYDLNKIIAFKKLDIPYEIMDTIFESKKMASSFKRSEFYKAYKDYADYMKENQI